MVHGTCPECGEPWRQERRSGRPQVYCTKACQKRASLRRLRAANPDRYRAYAKRYWEADRDKHRAKVRRQREKKRALIREAKNRPCADCGGVFPPWVMEFDHVHGEKLFEIGRKGTQKRDDIVRAEIAKCEAVCANCHRERTEVRRRGGDA